jgi:hypothetical protein
MVVAEREGANDWRRSRVMAAAVGESRVGDGGGRRGGGWHLELAEEAAKASSSREEATTV